ncbi:ArsR family transcriptional regulator [Cellulomonas sp. DKR-3]|uniref:ArsR family transcriptional regulator n=1 Tax=Cellulomonas fulva TaxID=2835530 RepID=A0ABS5U2H3_9CELL|nr:ArsR family transcriptional regulator [Cellulomonas fulva]MBT0995595.1 ArsR family transcriptional regulator [Cellulomonas fulva]
MPATRRLPLEGTLAAASRVELLHLLQRGGQHTVSELAQSTGLHQNTTREHLARLVQDGLAARAPEVRTVRGRPRILYRAASPDDAREDPETMRRLERSIAQVALTRVLLEGYGRDLGPTAEAARSAGRALTAPGGVLEPALGSRSPAASDEDRSDRAAARQLDALEGHLDRLGFDPARDDDGLRVDLWRCPFVELARQRPEVVCSVHLGLAAGVLATAGGPVTAHRLRPFVGRSHCVLELRRAASDEGSSAGGTSTAGPSPSVSTLDFSTVGFSTVGPAAPDAAEDRRSTHGRSTAQEPEAS